jgi:hypothetical protein
MLPGIQCEVPELISNPNYSVSVTFLLAKSRHYSHRPR